MRRESELISDKWKQYEENKERKEQLGCVIFGVLFIALIFTVMILKSIYGG